MPYSNVDWIAENLAKIGATARNMPPSWDGAKVAIPVCSPEGGCIGKALPGRGLFVNRDLKSIGITKPVPGVFQKTPVMRLADALKSERRSIAMAAALAVAAAFPRSALHRILDPLMIGALSTYDGILANRAGGKAFDVSWTKNSATTTTTNVWYSLFDTGGLPVAGSFTASPGAAPTSATTGALSFGLPDPGGSDSAYLLTFGICSSAQLNITMLIDLLVQVGSILINNTAFTVSSTALTRYTTGAGVMMTLEVTTALSATNAGSITVSYTNQAGTAGQVTASTALTVSGLVKQLQPTTLGPFIQLVSGDYGVRAVANVTSSGATATTGVVALNLYYPIMMMVGVPGASYIERDSMGNIDGVATQLVLSGGHVGCLALYVYPNSASSGQVVGFFRTVQG